MRALIVFATIKGEKMSKGDWPRPVNKKKFDEEFDRIFKKEKRKARIMELDPMFADVIIQRYQNYTGKDAIHLETNKTYNELQKDTENGQ